MIMVGGPIRATDPATFAAALPEAADVVIIGGGIAGIATALYLARGGVSVVVCEKGRVAAEQSSRNWGWVRQQGRDPAELPVMIESMRLWQALAAELGEEAGFHQCGVTYLAGDEAELARFEDWLVHARHYGLDTRMVSRAELQATLPNGAAWAGAMATPSDARAEPWTAVPAMARLARDAGAVIIEDCAARTLDLAGGAVAGVQTELGLIRTTRVLLAGGAWSSLFAANAGFALPQLSVRATVCATMPMPEFWQGAAADGDIAFRRRQDGGYTLAPGTEHDFWIGPDAFRNLRAYREQIRRDIRHTRLRPWAPHGYPDAWTTRRRWKPGDVTPFERMRVLDPAPGPGRVARLQQDFRNAFAEVEEVPVARAWAGMIDTLPDQVPILDESPIPGLFIATGLSGHGFGIGRAKWDFARYEVMDPW